MPLSSNAEFLHVGWVAPAMANSSCPMLIRYPGLNCTFSGCLFHQVLNSKWDGEVAVNDAGTGAEHCVATASVAV